MEHRIKLGMKVRDVLTGVEGTAIARTEWLHGCERITIQPEGVKDGKAFETHTVDEPQIEIIDATSKETAAPRHGARDDPPRAVDPA